MAVEANLRSKTLYKTEILVIKYIPFILALLYFINTTLSLVDINASVLSYIAGVSILPWLFLFISSFVFKFCIYHRIPLYYILINDAINIVDEYVHFPVSNLEFISIHMVIFCICLIAIIMLRKKCNHDNNIKEVST